MKFRQCKILINFLKNSYAKIMVWLLISGFTSTILADNNGGVIPTSDVDRTDSDSDFLVTLISIFQKEVLPAIEIIGGMVLVYCAIANLWKGFMDYQREHDLGTLKTAVVASAVITVVGGGLVYLLDYIRTYQFS